MLSPISYNQLHNLFSKQHLANLVVINELIYQLMNNKTILSKFIGIKATSFISNVSTVDIKTL